MTYKELDRMINERIYLAIKHGESMADERRKMTPPVLQYATSHRAAEDVWEMFWLPAEIGFEGTVTPISPEMLKTVKFLDEYCNEMGYKLLDKAFQMIEDPGTRRLQILRSKLSQLISHKAGIIHKDYIP